MTLDIDDMTLKTTVKQDKYTNWIKWHRIKVTNKPATKL